MEQLVTHRVTIHTGQCTYSRLRHTYTHTSTKATTKTWKHPWNICDVFKEPLPNCWVTVSAVWMCTACECVHMCLFLMLHVFLHFLWTCFKAFSYERENNLCSCVHVWIFVHVNKVGGRFKCWMEAHTPHTPWGISAKKYVLPSQGNFWLKSNFSVCTIEQGCS